MGDHTESLRVAFDPDQISYRELLKVFWASHNPLSPSWSRQYMTAIFVHDEEQRATAEESLTELVSPMPSLRASIVTKILPAQAFYPAEDYHQKYSLQRDKTILQELMRYYPTIEQLTRSTAAARLNGILGDYGKAPTTPEELKELGLGPSALRLFQRR